MAIDICSEISSPRISFSHDLNQKDHGFSHIERRLDSSLLDSSSDFDFCIDNSRFFQELSSADELFSNGKILPVEIKKKKQIQQPPPSSSSSSSSPPQVLGNESCTEKKRLKELLSLDDDQDYDKPLYKSFWQFKRSSSLNCDSSRSKSLIKSLQFLSRSNSTGSAPSSKLSSMAKETQKQNLQRQPSVSRKSKVSSSGSYSSSFNNNNNFSSTQKPPWKKNCGSYNNANNGVRISPVLNIPPPYISSATVNLFGLGSIFCNGKFKKKKR
ncbi:probable membrane-associated kinase regulator 1 [Mangifera indica]|uniref:probable membrane-associated kinase regulator 1 n=1 Tax=Mangifera indica TaxID=29780 RepID=UPI001CFAB810|nr:probable membrane-associated kinase regulator 1 [Mangifera indica]